MSVDPLDTPRQHNCSNRDAHLYPSGIDEEGRHAESMRLDLCLDRGIAGHDGRVHRCT